MAMTEQIIFISRELKNDSLFHSSFNKKISIKAYSLLDFSPIHFSNFPETDFIFFYSQNAVHFFFSQLEKKDINTKLCCMGKGTKKVLESLGYSVYFTGAGNPDEIAYSFLDICKNKKVLFPRAKQSKKSIQKRILGEVDVFDLVVYDNQKKNVFPHPNAGVLVFTSPMNVEAYFDLYKYKNEKLVSIGSTTQQKLYSMGFNDVKKAKENSEAALVELVKEIIDGE